MYSAKITQKLSILYCTKSEFELDQLYNSQYGINCGSISLPVDIDLRIQLLEYYKNFTEEDLVDILKTKKCLKTLING